MGAGVHAVTDVTGFGLAGHAWEMAERSGARVVVETDRLPLYDGALAAAERGVRTGGDKRNREYLARARAQRGARTPSTPCASTRRPPAACWPRSTPELVGAAEAAGFTVVGRVEAGEPGVRLA